MNRKSVAVFLSALIIFLFWLLLSINNYFHADEWEFFMRMRLPVIEFLSMSYMGHFMPLLELHHYILLKLFGLNYIPFQITTSFFHAINSIFLYLTLFKLTKNPKLSILGMLFFGLSSVGIEVPIWSLNVAAALVGTFLYLGFFLFLDEVKKINFRRTFLICTLLFISPLWYDLSILCSFAFCFMILVLGKGNEKFKAAGLYFLTGVLSLSILLHFSTLYGVESPFKNPVVFISNFIQFIISGVFGGLITKFFLPTLYFFIGTSTFVGQFVRPAIYFAGAIGSVFLTYKLIKTNKLSRIVQAFFLTFPLIVICYAAIAIGRTSFGAYFARIPRYAYLPSFFLTVFVIILLHTLNIKNKFVYLGACLIIGLHLAANWNFEQHFWKPQTDRDRAFIQKIEYLFANNKEIVDYHPTKFNEFMSLSKLWFLPSYKEVKFIDRKNSLEEKRIIQSSDSRSKKIYEELYSKY